MVSIKRHTSECQKGWGLVPWYQGMEIGEEEEERRPAGDRLWPKLHNASRYTVWNAVFLPAPNPTGGTSQ